MASIKYPDILISLLNGESHRIPWVKQREKFTNFVEYEIKDDDVFQSPAHVYSSIANKIYGDEKLWYILDDANPLFHESQLRSGMKIQIPDITKRSSVVSSVITTIPK